jgi:hypothetical protein
MTKVIQFTGLRTRTSFHFKNKKEESKYWDDMLKESALRYKNTFSKYLNEKLHVYISFYKIFQWSSLAMLLPFWIAVANKNIPLMYGNTVIIAILAGVSIIYYLKSKTQLSAIAMLEVFTDILEDVREDMLKEENNKNK